MSDWRHVKGHGLTLKRVDDAFVGPGQYQASCDCGWKSGLRSQSLIGEEFREHLREQGSA